MYSHDTYGLGHLRRTMAIAEHLRHRGVNILILTGSPLAGRYETPKAWISCASRHDQEDHEEYCPFPSRSTLAMP